MRSFLAAAILALASVAWAGEGADLEIGHFGTGQGRLSGVTDLTFDAAGNLYVLDWGLSQNNTTTGNALVQVYDPAGKFLRQIPLAADTVGAKMAPARLAVDGRGQVWVTQPKAGLVQRFAADGQPLPPLTLPGATAIATHGKQVFVVADLGKKAVPDVAVFDLDGAQQPALRLERPVTGAVDLAIDSQGRLDLLAATNQLYQFSPEGKLLATVGSGMTTRAQDGSELIHSVAVDSAGNVYAMTWGNPGMLVRFDPALKTVRTREGQFKWADAWSVHSAYTPLAVDPHDRLWLGVSGRVDDNDARYHFKPCVLRVTPDFLDTTQHGVTVASTKALGFRPTIETGLPYDVAYAAGPLPLEFVVAAAQRRVSAVTVDWRMQDSYGVVAQRGRFELPLTDGAEARQRLTVTPPRFGWYTVTAQVGSQGEPLMTFGHHLGVTPAYQSLPRLAAGESPGGPTDIPRSAWCGLTLYRVNTGMGTAELDKQVALAAKYGCTLLVQFESKERCTPDQVKAMAEHFRGRVKYWEVVNEPNFTLKPEQYVTLLKQVRETIRAADPDAVVMGPDVCGIDLGWYQKFYELGGGPLVDVLSIHDYEGHESIDPNHWVWKLGELRALMAKHGDAAKAIWQTERAIGGVRGDNFLGGAQAVRVTLHRDLLERLGIPSGHNLHYYLNDHGYSQVPTFLWSAAGPHPGALALRTRAGQIGDRAFADTLDFGDLGNRLFWGTRYVGPDGSTVVLRNLGLADEPLDFELRGAPTLEASDAFGNAVKVPVTRGKLQLTLGQMPLYVRLPVGATLVPTKLAGGINLALGARFSYSAETKTDFARLTNGIYETIHAGNPHGGTDKPPIWSGALPSLPQSLEIDFGQPRLIGQVVVHGLRADNAFCALLDADLERRDGGRWISLGRARTPCPPTEAVKTPLSVANTWYLDTNLFWFHFAPVRASKLRLTARRVSYGFLPDAGSRAWGNAIPSVLMLKEIEVLGPAR